jgi:cobalamin biosynthesis Mg chelatase CobN
MAERLRKKFDEQWRLLSRQMDKEAKAEARALAGADVVMKPVKDSKRDGERGRKHSPGERMKTPKAEKKRPTSSDKAAAKAAAKAARAEERRRKRSRPSSDSTDSGQHRRSNGASVVPLVLLCSLLVVNVSVFMWAGGGGGGGGGVDQSILEEMKNEMVRVVVLVHLCLCVCGVARDDPSP